MNIQLVKSQWFGKNVAFLGDSITDACHVGTTKNYWEFLEEMLGIHYLVYGINGHRWNGILGQAQKLKAEHPDDVDAIIIFVGTNDYNGSVLPGQWWTLVTETVNSHGVEMVLPRRILSKDINTVCGNINVSMQYLRENFPNSQIILMTPIHRGYANFGGNNVQPEEFFPNNLGLYVESYVELIRQAADNWSTPLIDLFRNSGLLPWFPSQGNLFHDENTDRLHPSAIGHYRIAKTMAYQMLALPADFN